MANTKAKRRGKQSTLKSAPATMPPMPSVPAASQWLQQAIGELATMSNWPNWLRDHDRIAERLRAESHERFERNGWPTGEPADVAPPFAPLAVEALVAAIGNHLPLVETALAPLRTQFANVANSAGAIQIGKSKSYGSAHDAAVYVLREFMQAIWRTADPRGYSLAALDEIKISGGRVVEPRDYGAFDTDKIFENWQEVNVYLAHYTIEPDGATIAGRMQQELASILRDEALANDSRTSRAGPASSSQGLLPAGKVWRGKFRSLSEFRAFLKRHPEITTTRNGQRLLVDASGVILAHDRENEAQFKALGTDADKADAGRELRQAHILKRKKAAGERGGY